MGALEDIAVDHLAFSIGAFVGAVAGILVLLLVSVVSDNPTVQFAFFLVTSFATWATTYRSIR